MYHRDTLPSGEESDFRTGRSGMHRRAAPPPQPAALSHCATLARRSRSVSTTWTATRAAQSWVKMVSIGPQAILMILSIHLNGAVLVSVHALSLSLLCLPLVLSTVHNFCAWGCFCSPCSINSIAFLSAPRKLVHRRHGKPSIALLNRDPEQANIHSHAIRRCTCYTCAPLRTPDGQENPSNARSQALDRALTTAGDAAAERARTARLQSVSRPPGGMCWRMCLQ